MSTAFEDSGGRTPSAALRAAWDILLATAGDAGYAVAELVRPPATPEQVAVTERAIGRRLPDDLAGLYLLSNGQVDWWQLVEGPAGTRERGRGRWVGALFGDGWSFDTLSELAGGYRTWADVRGMYTAEELAADFDELIEVRTGDPVLQLFSAHS